MEGSLHASAMIHAMNNKSPLPQIDYTVHTLEDGSEVNTLERIYKDVQAPTTERPTDEQFWSSSNRDKPNLSFLRDHFDREGRLTEEQALWIIRTGTKILRAEDTLLEMKTPIAICGDISGQYYDLMKLLRKGGDPSTTQYLFLGNYINRGYFGIECLLYLWSLKITHPGSFWLLRGNHECRHLTDYFTFKMECKHKYSEEVYEACMESFDCLPLAALLNERFLCVHGGLSPELQTLQDLRELVRFRETPTSGLMCDILWSDPTERYGEETVADHFTHNHTRGISYFFTYQAVLEFLERNRLLTIIRAHEAQEPGYRLYRKTTTKGFPSLVTIFSAPNYLDLYNNTASILKIDNSSFTITQFNCSPHPYHLPNFMDAFTWSLPFVGEKINDVLIAILSICSEFQEEDLLLSAPSSTTVTPAVPLTASSDPDSIEFRRRAIKNKILAIGRLSRIFSVLREESEIITSINLASGSHLPAGTLTIGAETIKSQIHNFEDARKFDLQNARLPPSHAEAYAVTQRERNEALDRALEAADNDPSINRIARMNSPL